MRLAVIASFILAALHDEIWVYKIVVLAVRQVFSFRQGIRIMAKEQENIGFMSLFFAKNCFGLVYCHVKCLAHTRAA